MPQQHSVCQHPVYQHLRQIIISATSQEPPQYDHKPVAGTVALLGAHGVGKTALAVQLVHDVATNFAEGVTWIQLGANVAEEELVDQLIRCVDSLIAGDFRSSVRYCSSVSAVLARASRLLSHVSTLLVVDDVVGHGAKQALEAIVSTIGPSSLVLYTAPHGVEDDQYKLLNASCVAKIGVRPLPPNAPEASLMFRAWLPKSMSAASSSTDFVHANELDEIIRASHGLPLALSMSAGFLSRFPADWSTLASTLSSCKSGDDTVFRVLGLLRDKGKGRFERQLRDIACLPEGIWISLSALADLWDVDYQSIKESARRMGRIAFADYRLGDTSDDSRVRFHSHVYHFCQRLASDDDIIAAHRKLLENMRNRRSQTLKSRLKTHYLSWWTACFADSYTSRRLHWHMFRARQLDRLRELICDYDWLCQRLEQHSLIGVLSEFATALYEEEESGSTAEAEGIEAILETIQAAGKLRKSDLLGPSAFPTFLVTNLHDHERSSLYVKELLESTYEKARRPWLKPIPATEPPLLSSVTDTDSDSISEDSESWSSSAESEPAALVAHCLASTSSGKVVCGARNGNIQVYDPATGKNIVSWSASMLSGDVNDRCLGAIETVQEFIISGHKSGRMYLRSIRTGQTEVIEESLRTQERVCCLATTEDGVVAVGSDRGSLYVLKYVDDFGCKATRYDLEGHCDSISSLYVFPDGRKVASSSFNGFANVWTIDEHGENHGRVSLNGHLPSIGHKENYITTFSSIGGGRRLLSSCRAGVVNAWNAETGDCLWTQHYGYQFSRSLSLQAFGIRHFASGRREGVKAMRLLNVGYPYMITRGEGGHELLIVTAGNSKDVMAIVAGDQMITNWLEIWHAGSESIYVAVCYGDGRLLSYELVTALK
ncbi:WD40-repeat containing protein [Gracilaria domingensis]|nr:WD40-repeat containing protein [Gracilaria domingensis]